jgi:hypothetical protein
MEYYPVLNSYPYQNAKGLTKHFGKQTQLAQPAWPMSGQVDLGVRFPGVRLASILAKSLLQFPPSFWEGFHVIG